MKVRVPVPTTLSAIGLSPFVQGVIEIAAQHEAARARLATIVALLNTDQAVVEEMLAQAAKEDCGVPTNISTAAINRVADRLSRSQP